MSRHRVRSLTLAHLDRLVAIGVLASACSRDVGYGVVDPMPEPVGTEPSKDDGSKGTIPEAGQGATTTPEPPPPPQDRGYAVVDPAPPPPEPCETLAGSVYATAFAQEDSVQLTISSGRRRDVTFSPASEVTATNATISSATDSSDGMRLVLVMKGQTAAVTLQGTCRGQPETVEIRLTAAASTPRAFVRTAVVPAKGSR